MDTAFTILRVALSLGVVFGLLFVLQKRLAKGQFGTAQRGRRSASLEVVARKGIGGKASVVVVDVEGERLVLGVSEHGVRLLTSGEAPAPVLELAPVAQIAPAAVEQVTAAPTPAPVASADAFRQELEQQRQAEPSLPAALPMRPRDRGRRAQRAALPTQAQLQGSLLSADTWKQAAAALRSRRAG